MNRRQQKAMFAKKQSFNGSNISKIPETSGVYKFYSADGKLLYIGVAKKRKYGNLKHRIESYHEKDDFNEHPTKKQLRPKIKKFTYASVPITTARKIERLHKNHTPYNKDENIGHT